MIGNFILECTVHSIFADCAHRALKRLLSTLPWVSASQDTAREPLKSDHIPPPRQKDPMTAPPRRAMWKRPKGGGVEYYRRRPQTLNARRRNADSARWMWGGKHWWCIASTAANICVKSILISIAGWQYLDPMQPWILRRAPIRGWCRVL